MMEEIKSKVIQIISEQLGKDESEIKMNSHFIEDLDADSLDTVELVMALEEEFEMPTVFILPGGSQASAAIDLARCVIRTAERRVVAMAEQDGLTNGLIMTYLNRLGDLLFVLARYEDRDIPIERAT